MAERIEAVTAMPVNVADYEALAAERLEPGVLGYYAGGAGDERTLRDNVDAFTRRRLRPRVLVDVSDVSTATTVLGTEVSMPVLVAPTALQRLAHPDGEPGMARAAAAAGTIFTLSTLATSRPREVFEQAPPAPRWFQLYAFRDAAVTRALCQEAIDCGFDAIVLTVDAPRAGRRERDLRTGFAVPSDVDMPAVRAAIGAGACPTPAEFFSLVDASLTWATVERLAGEIDLPVVVKGIQTGQDATLACEHGAAAVVVSNHGGRQLDGVAASIDLLPEAVEAVGGRLEVLVDGGIRRGTDVAVALALGARAVLVGRPALWGLAAAGESGARHLLELLREELHLALLLLGCRTPAHVTREHVS
ncbi:MAG TPA: alpha-hydroxy acid oxidase [Solirubrobacteraceae bacterium]|nr:alpha-hydroxy acid oxidase [Solirubrobacteraceae bacterium]